MINKLFYTLQRPEKGWDPVPLVYAEQYAARCYSEDLLSTLQDVKNFVGDLRGKEVLDLGGGPGQYSAKFSEEGANVTWYDISKNYKMIFERKYPAWQGTKTIGYLDDAKGQYDLVFNRVCWYYCMNDQDFAQRIVDLVRPGGFAYLLIPHEGNEKFASHVGITKYSNLIRCYLNNLTGIKIGHPMLSTRRLKKILATLDVGFFSIETLLRDNLVKIRK